MGLRVDRTMSASPTFMLGASNTPAATLGTVENTILPPSMAEVSGAFVVVMADGRPKGAAIVPPNCPGMSSHSPSVGLGAEVGDDARPPSMTEVSSAVIMVVLVGKQGRTMAGPPFRPVVALC